MAIFAVEYTYDVAKLDVLTERRPKHREFLRSLFEEGKLLASGPLGSSHALIVVTAENETAALQLLDADPLAHAEVIETRTARAWNPVIGPWQ